MTGCIEWAGPCFSTGYGRYGHRGYAHRAVWEAIRGPIPSGLEVMHLCDNPPCVNVNHLRLGTHAENMADMKVKGRGRGGAPVGRVISAETRGRIGAALRGKSLTSEHRQKLSMALRGNQNAKGRGR